MAKNQTSGNVKRNDTGRVVSPTQSKRLRKILFPTEPTTIPHEKIDRAIEQVMSRRK